MTAEEFASSYMGYIAEEAEREFVPLLSMFNAEFNNSWFALNITASEALRITHKADNGEYPFMFESSMSKFYCTMSETGRPRMIQYYGDHLWTFMFELKPEVHYDFMDLEYEEGDEHITFTEQELLEFLNSY